MFWYIDTYESRQIHITYFWTEEYLINYYFWTEEYLINYIE
jgi:hypothetical protein